MNLLKEAISEARAVRDIAKQNAISTLTEAFTPQMQSLLSKKIAEEEEIEDDELDLPSETPEETPEMPEDSTEGEEVPADDSEEDDLDIDEVLKELEGSDEEDTMEIPEEDDEMEEALAEEEEIDDDMIDEIINEVEDELEAETMEEEECDDDDVEMAAENVKLQKNLKEALKVIKTQQTILNEVGVLNAKLLYTTKILGKHELTEAQKLRILEAFDRANSLKEAKLVYSTIIGSLKKPAMKNVKRVNEGGASKAVKTISKPINESSNFVNKERWGLLAGITNNV